MWLRSGGGDMFHIGRGCLGSLSASRKSYAKIFGQHMWNWFPKTLIFTPLRDVFYGIYHAVYVYWISFQVFCSNISREPKAHACLYCESIIIDGLKRHLLQVHKKHPDIIKLLEGENDHDFMAREIKRLTIEGDALWNSKNKNDNPLVRRKPNGSSRTLDETGSSQAVSIHEYVKCQECSIIVEKNFLQTQMFGCTKQEPRSDER